MRPIPKRLLPDTAFVSVPDEEADEGGAFQDPVEIGHVRYDRTASIRHTDYQLQDGTSGLVFIDAVNSEGAFEVPAGSLVKIRDVEVCVNATHVFETFGGRVHHWELEVH